MNKKISSMGLLSVLAAVCLVVGIFTAINRAGFHSVYLNDTKSNHNGWKYEIRTDSGEVKKAVPQYTGEYDYTLSDESYNAVRRSRIMTETLANASLELDCVQCGVEMFLDDHLLYSDFQTVERDAYGYLLMEGIDIQNEWRCVAVSLPEDYSGKKLIIITYFPQDTEYRYALDPHLQSTDTVVSTAIAETVMPILWLVFCGCMVLGVAAAAWFPCRTGSCVSKWHYCSLCMWFRLSCMRISLLWGIIAGCRGGLTGYLLKSLLISTGQG